MYQEEGKCPSPVRVRFGDWYSPMIVILIRVFISPEKKEMIKIKIMIKRLCGGSPGRLLRRVAARFLL
jgi:hypothetical protein